MSSLFKGAFFVPKCNKIVIRIRKRDVFISEITIPKIIILGIVIYTSYNSPQNWPNKTKGSQANT